MRIEKVILSIAGLLAGLFVAGIAFYIYQTTRTISPGSIKTITLQKPTPSDAQSVPLALDSPSPEAVVASRIVTISGRTDANATIIVTTDSSDIVVSPTSTGAFSIDITIASGENRIFITAVMPDGKETQKQLTVSATSENF